MACRRILMLYPEFECNCSYCQKLCYTRVGWPTPEEGKALVEYFKSRGYPLKTIFRKFLVLDFYDFDEERVYVVAPRWTECGEELFAPFFPLMTEGSCVFKEGERCVLHNLTYNRVPLKPLECRVGGCRAGKLVARVHREIAQAWRKEQDFVENIIGEVG